MTIFFCYINSYIASLFSFNLKFLNVILNSFPNVQYYKITLNKYKNYQFKNSEIFLININLNILLWNIFYPLFWSYDNRFNSWHCFHLHIAMETEACINSINCLRPFGVANVRPSIHIKIKLQGIYTLIEQLWPKAPARRRL